MSEEMRGQRPSQTPESTWQEKLGAVANELGSRTRELVQASNARQLVIEHEGRRMATLPLTLAALIGVVAVLVAPALAVIGTVAALLARVRARVELKG